MKKTLICFLLAAAIASCKKDTNSTKTEEQKDTVSRTSEADMPDPILVGDETVMAKSTTVTTEAAL